MMMNAADAAAAVVAIQEIAERIGDRTARHATARVENYVNLDFPDYTTSEFAIRDSSFMKHFVAPDEVAVPLHRHFDWGTRLTLNGARVTLCGDAAAFDHPTGPDAADRPRLQSMLARVSNPRFDRTVGYADYRGRRWLLVNSAYEDEPIAVRNCEAWRLQRPSALYVTRWADVIHRGPRFYDGDRFDERCVLPIPAKAPYERLTRLMDVLQRMGSRTAAPRGEALALVEACAGAELATGDRTIVTVTGFQHTHRRVPPGRATQYCPLAAWCCMMSPVNPLMTRGFPFGACRPPGDDRWHGVCVDDGGAVLVYGPSRVRLAAPSFGSLMDRGPWMLSESELPRLECHPVACRTAARDAYEEGRPWLGRAERQMEDSATAPRGAAASSSSGAAETNGDEDEDLARATAMNPDDAVETDDDDEEEDEDREGNGNGAYRERLDYALALGYAAAQRYVATSRAEPAAPDAGYESPPE